MQELLMSTIKRGFKPTPGSWETLVPNAFTLQGGAVGIIGDLAVIWRSFWWTTTINISEMYHLNLKTNQLEKVTVTGTIPPVTTNSGSCVYNGKLILSGGMLVGGTTYSSENYAYDPTNKVWEKIVSLTQTLYGHTIFVRNGKLCVFGGAQRTIQELSDSGTWSSISPTSPSQQYYTTSRLVGNYLTSGLGLGSSWTPGFKAYDFDAGTWKTLAGGGRKMYPATAVHNGRLLCFGGQNASGVQTRNVLAYDPQANTMEDLGTTYQLVQSYENSAHSFENGRIITVGGTNASNGSPNYTAINSLVF